VTSLTYFIYAALRAFVYRLKLISALNIVQCCASFEPPLISSYFATKVPDFLVFF